MHLHEVSRTCSPKCSVRPAPERILEPKLYGAPDSNAVRAAMRTAPGDNFGIVECLTRKLFLFYYRLFLDSSVCS